MLGNGESQNGRRRRITKESQALPLFMSAGRSRVGEQVMMSAATSREMHRYLRWASEAARVARDEAQVMMLDRAIADYLKKDEAWQAEKAAAGGADGAEETAAEAPSVPGVRGQPGPRAPGQVPGRVPESQTDGGAKGPAADGAGAKGK